MKRFDEIEPVKPEDSNPQGEPWESDILVATLIQQGHKPIAVGRAIMVVTQCEAGDDFPKGWSEEPLRIAIYGDTDVTGDEVPMELFLHGGRFGLMETFFRINRTDGSHDDRIMTPIDMPHGQDMLQNPDPLKVVEAMLDIARFRLSGLYYRYEEENGAVAGISIVDPALVELGMQVIKTLEAYRDYIRAHTP